jgi:hypothetical protein
MFLGTTTSSTPPMLLTPGLTLTATSGGGSNSNNSGSTSNIIGFAHSPSSSNGSLRGSPQASRICSVRNNIYIALPSCIMAYITILS